MNKTNIIKQINKDLKKNITLSYDDARRFFSGLYDSFLGITVKNLRKLVKKYEI